MNSIIYNNSWGGYRIVIKNFSNYLKLNHSKEFVNSESGANTNKIEGNWCGIRLQVPYKCRTHTLINIYLLRYMILRNENGNPLIALLNYSFYFF